MPKSFVPRFRYKPRFRRDSGRVIDLLYGKPRLLRHLRVEVFLLLSERFKAECLTFNFCGVEYPSRQWENRYTKLRGFNLIAITIAQGYRVHP